MWKCLKFSLINSTKQGQLEPVWSPMHLDTSRLTACRTVPPSSATAFAFTSGCCRSRAVWPDSWEQLPQLDITVLWCVMLLLWCYLLHLLLLYTRINTETSLTGFTRCDTDTGFSSWSCAMSSWTDLLSMIKDQKKKNFLLVSSEGEEFIFWFQRKSN